MLKKDHDIKDTLPLTDFILKSRNELIEDSKNKKTLLKPEDDVDEHGQQGQFWPRN